MALLLGAYSQRDAALLGAAVAAQIDARFMALDLSLGSRIVWPRVAADMATATGRAWPETCVRRALQPPSRW
jgi:hypothetical protein